MADNYITVCNTDDIRNGGRQACTVGGEDIIVFNINRQFYAVKNRCTHLDFPLADGRQIGTDLMCKHHGARFDICTGKVLGGPAVFDLKTYPVRVIDGHVQVAVESGE
jgi:3-phenylpropionate/trans-cinnamate dioxygenase ferredoxin component